MDTITLTYREAVYVRHILEDHIRDEAEKKAYDRKHFKGERHLATCEAILDNVTSQMRKE